MAMDAAEVANIGVKLTLDASNFNSGMTAATEKTGAFAAAAKEANSQMYAGGGKSVPGRQPAQNLSGVNVSLSVSAAQLKTLRTQIIEGLGAIPINITPVISKAVRGEAQAIVAAQMTPAVGTRSGAAHAVETAVKRNLPGRAHGGPVQQGRPIVVGEHRAEVFRPGASGWIEKDVREYRRREAELAALEYQIAQRQKRIGRMAGGPVEQIPVRSLLRYREIDREHHPRWAHDFGYLDELTEKIRTEGMQRPVEVWYSPTMHAATVADGNHRLAVAQRLGMETVPTTVMVPRGSRLRGAKRLPGDPVDLPEGFYPPSQIGLKRRGGPAHAWRGATARAWQQTLAQGGGTFPVDPRTPVPGRGHALGISAFLEGAQSFHVPQDDPIAFMRAFHAQRRAGAPYVGTWLDPDTGLIDVDPSTVIRRRDRADLVLRAGHEKAAYDLGAGETWYASNRGLRAQTSRIMDLIYGRKRHMGGPAHAMAGKLDVSGIEGNLRNYFTVATPEQFTSGKEWYQTWGKELRDAASRLGRPPEILTSVAAALSPNNGWPGNFHDAIRYAEARSMGLPMPKAPTFVANQRKAWQILIDADSRHLKGLKVNPFGAALLGDPNAKPQDIWMKRAAVNDLLLPWTKGTPAPRQRREMDRVIDLIASEQGLEPRQVQAIIWMAARERGMALAGMTSHARMRASGGVAVAGQPHGLVHPGGGFLSQIFQTAADWANDPFMAIMAYQSQQQKRQGGGGVTVDPSFSRVRRIQQKPIISTLESLSDEYGIPLTLSAALPGDRWIKQLAGEGPVAAYTTPWNIRFNPRALHPDALFADYMGSIASIMGGSGRTSVGAGTVEGIATHEFGHLLHHATGIEGMQWIQRNKSGILTRPPSKYALSSPLDLSSWYVGGNQRRMPGAEAFAESFAAAKLYGEDPFQILKTIGKPKDIQVRNRQMIEWMESRYGRAEGGPVWRRLLEQGVITTRNMGRRAQQYYHQRYSGFDEYGLMGSGGPGRKAFDILVQAAGNESDSRWNEYAADTDYEFGRKSGPNRSFASRANLGEKLKLLDPPGRISETEALNRLWGKTSIRGGFSGPRFEGQWSTIEALLNLLPKKREWFPPDTRKWNINEDLPFGGLASSGHKKVRDYLFDRTGASYYGTNYGWDTLTGKDFRDPLQFTEAGYRTLHGMLKGRNNATGGFTGDGLYIVGEIGKELFVPNRLAHLIPPKVMEQIPKRASGGIVEIGRKRNELFAPPEDGIIIPNRLIDQIPHAMAGIRPGGGEIDPFWSNPQSFEERLVANLSTPQLRQYPSEPNPAYGVSSGYRPSQMAAQSVSAQTVNVTASGSTTVNTQNATAAGAAGAAAVARGTRGREPGVIGPQRHVVDTRGMSEEEVRALLSGAPVAGVASAGSPAEEAQRRAGERYREARRFGELPTSVNPELEGHLENLRIRRAGEGTTMGGRTARGMIASVGSWAFGGRQQFTKEQAIAAKAQQEYNTQLRLSSAVINRGTYDLDEYKTKLEEGNLTAEQRSEIETKVTKTTERMARAHKDLAVAGDRAIKAEEKALPTTGGVLRNLGVIIGATSAYGMAMSAASTLIDQVAIPTLGKMIDSISGFGSTNTRVTKELGQGILEAGGNIEAAFGKAAAGAGIGGAGTAYLQKVLGASATAKAAGTTEGAASELFRAAAGQGRAPTGLYGGYGGILGTSILGDVMGGGKGFLEQIAGNFTQIGNKIAKPSSTTAAPLSPGASAQDIANYAWMATANQGRVYETPLTDDQKEQNRKAASAMAVYAADLTDAGKRGAAYFGEADKAFKVVSVSSEDMRDKMVEAARETGDADAVKYAEDISRQGYALTDALGNVVSSAKEFEKGWGQIAKGRTITDIVTYSHQVAQSLRASFEGATEQAKYQASIRLPAQIGEELAAQPFIRTSAGVLPTVKGGPAASGTVKTLLARAAATEKELTASVQPAINAQALWIKSMAAADPALNGMVSALGATDKTVTTAAGAYIHFMGKVTDSGKVIAKYQEQIADTQLNAQTVSYTNSLRLANRAYQDALGLAGRGGSKLGQMERAQTMLGFGLQQKQINFSVAMAGFQAPGLTSEERAARQEEAKIEASYAQKQLNLSRGIFTEQAGRGVTDTGAAVRVMKVEWEAARATAAANKVIAAEQQKMAIAQAKASMIVQRAEGTFSGTIGAATTYVSQFGTSVQQATDQLRKALGMAPIERSGRNEARRESTGYLGAFASGATFTVGEAGPETVAILRNPRSSSLLPGSMGGGGAATGGPVTVNLYVTVQGDVKDEAVIAKMVRAVEDSFNRKAARLGMRSLVSATG